MRLALADIPKRFSRRDGVSRVAPRMLRPRAARGELAALIGLFEASLGLTRAEFAEDRPAQIIGDHRMARCLSTCLGDWYEWEAASWPLPAASGEAASLASHEIAGPSDLRLALYAYVNAEHGGFLTAGARESAVDGFASSLGVSRPTLDALLTLDDTRTARLARRAEVAPTPAQLAARYNQLAVEGLLATASEVTWRIEPHGGAPLGTAVKRVCFLARRSGVTYEVAFEGAKGPDTLDASMAFARLVAESGERYVAPTSLENARQPVVITLYGPREVMGGVNQYGDRLARLCRALLGYRRAAPDSAAFANLGALSGEAMIHLHGRPCVFTLDDRLTRLLHTSEDAGGETALPDDERFDSSLERRLSADFGALERAGESAGWRLEREPEPVIIGDTILIPDFALTRDQRRVYLEVAGYWRPDYRARKARKLATLAGAVALIVAAPESARSEFTGLDATYPFLWYRDDAISAPALIGVIERAYDDFPARLASLDLSALLVEVSRRGVIPPREASAALRAYSRAEHARAASALARYAVEHAIPAPEWVDGLGLCSPARLDALGEEAREAVARAGGRMPLSDFSAQLSIEHRAEEVAGALALRAGLQIERASLFAANVVAPDQPGQAPLPGAPPDQDTTSALDDRPRKPQPRKPTHRTHSGARWSAETLFPARFPTAADGSEPDATLPQQRDETRRQTR